VTSTVLQHPQLRLTLIRSTFGRLGAHRQCIKGLGLHRMHETVEVTATPEVMGMVKKTAFMLRIEEIQTSHDVTAVDK
jgi:large subunit ribosomal protein L30